MKSPSEKLAQRIVERLVKEGLLTEKRGKGIQSKLASGTVSADDWKAEIDLSTEPSKAEVSK